MDEKTRIEQAIIKLDQAVTGLLSKNVDLKNEVSELKAENTKLRERTELAISQIDSHLSELERIRRDHGSRNSSN